MTKLRTTREDRARQLTDSAPVFLSHQLAADVETLLSALVAEKRAHAEIRVIEGDLGEAWELRAEADALEKELLR